MLAMTLRTQPGPGSQTEGYTHWVDIVACAPLAKTTVITEFKKKKRKKKGSCLGPILHLHYTHSRCGLSETLQLIAHKHLSVRTCG